MHAHGWHLVQQNWHTELEATSPTPTPGDQQCWNKAAAHPVVQRGSGLGFTSQPFSLLPQRRGRSSVLSLKTNSAPGTLLNPKQPDCGGSRGSSTAPPQPKSCWRSPQLHHPSHISQGSPFSPKVTLAHVWLSQG